MAASAESLVFKKIGASKRPRVEALTFNDCYREREKDDEMAKAMQAWCLHRGQSLKVAGRPLVDAADKLDSVAVRAALASFDKSLFNKTKDLLKTLYRLSIEPTHVQSPHNNNPCFDDICARFGSKIIAHGVEEAKGGMLNLLLMAITGQVKIDRMGWGKLIDGPPELSPLPHGPYYIISSINGGACPDKPSIDEIAYVLVPFQENVDIIEAKLTEFVDDSLLSAEDKELFVAKLISYKKFYNHLCSPVRVDTKEDPPAATGGFSAAASGAAAFAGGEGSAKGKVGADAKVLTGAGASASAASADGAPACARKLAFAFFAESREERVSKEKMAGQAMGSGL